MKALVFEVTHFYSLIKKEILFLAFFVFVSIIFTWPWAQYFNSSTYGAGHPFIVIWRLWWNNFAWQNNLNPAQTSLVGAPLGATVTDIADPILPFYLGHLLTRLLGNPVLAYNLIVFLSFPLSAYFTFVLIRYLTKRVWLAVLAGVLFAFSPYHLGHLGQFSLASVQFLPLLVYIFLKLREKQTLTRALILGIVLGVNALTDYYYGYFSGIFLASFLIFEGLLIIFFQRKRFVVYLRCLFYYVVAGVVFALLIVPVVYPRIFLSDKEMRAKLPLKTSLDDLIVHSARPWDYFLPPSAHPLFGNTTALIREDIRKERSNYWFFLPRTFEADIYLGWTVSFLALLAVILWLCKRGWRKNLVVPALFLTALLLMFISLPPDIYLGKNNEIHKILLSYRLHQLFPMFRAYVRLGVFVLLSFLMLAADALGAIQESFFKRGKAVVLGLFAFLMLLEFAALPFTSLNIFNRVPDVYRWLAQEPKGTIVAEMPEFRYFGSCSACLLFQSGHRQPLYGPAQLIYYDYARPLEENENLVPGGDSPSSKISNEAVALMKKSGVKYLIVPRRSWYRAASLTDFLLTNYSLGSFTDKLKLRRTFNDAYVFEVYP